MRLHPMISSLAHHKLTSGLLVLQVALTCAIGCNAVAMIGARASDMLLPTGIDELHLSVLRSTDADKHHDHLVQNQADLAALRAIPGVKAVVAVQDSLPLDEDDSSLTTCSSKQALDRASRQMSSEGTNCVEPSLYDGGPGEVGVLGLHLVEGRDFLPDEYTVPKASRFDAPPAAIISSSLAARLFPGQDALGRYIYTGAGTPIRVVGIVVTLLRPRLRTPSVNYYTMLWPEHPNEQYVSYVIKSDPADVPRIAKAATAALTALNPNRILAPMKTYREIRSGYFQRDFTMIGLLLASLGGLLFVTALGITGLTSFWVQQRTHQIGIRRAIGATRGEIMRQFQTENFLIVGAGVVLGLALAVVLNLALMHFYDTPRLPLYYLPSGAAALWLLGQFAVLSPALRAATVPPATAARSV